VLLKNQGGLLPFGEKVRDIAVFGPLAYAQASCLAPGRSMGRPRM
jgi:hypothetical protein